MKKNKGFTLVELIAVIIIIGVSSLIVVPIVEKITKDNKEKIYQTQLNNIILSLKNWASDNKEYLPEKENDFLTLTLRQLKAEGYVEHKVKNPKNNHCFDNSMVLKIVRVKKTYDYLIDLDTIKESDNCEVNVNKPSLILNGSTIENIEINSVYNDKGIIAKDKNGNDITSKVVKTITGSGNSIDTSKLNNQYVITYTVSDSGATAVVSRTVKIVDTTPPVLVIPGNSTLDIDETRFDVMNGVSATDNSGENVNIIVKSNISFGIPGKYTVTYTVIDSSGNKTIKKRIITVQMVYKDIVLNGADPELKEGLIPVIIENDGTVKKAGTNKEWYNYGSKIWANAVTVTESTRNNYMSAESGTIINEADILTYLTWIPRYKYKLWYTEAIDGESEVDITKVHSIDVVFEGKNTTKSKGNTNGTYLTHPAFTFGEEELNGIWVGKFETGYSGATDTAGAEQSTADSTKVIIKPSTYSWRYISISNMFATVKGMNTINTFGLNETSDTHMIKNIEWGAVAYLSHSEYGKDGQVYVNNYYQKKTGCGADTAEPYSSGTCSNVYGSKSDGIYNQSTTGNISGIFDMAGGVCEYVMGYTTGASIKYGSSGFTDATFPEDKYVDKYTSTSDLEFSKRILGDATGEMGPFGHWISSWYYQRAAFVDSDSPWFSHDLFDFGRGKGASCGCSFRVVLS